VETIISKGKNLHEAIRLGLEILETTKDQVNVEIIHNGKKGFLGIRSKYAVVKLTKKEPSTSSSAFSNIEQMLKMIEDDTPAKNNRRSFKKDIQNEIEKEKDEAKVWIKNGKLYSTSTSNHFPSITVHSGIKLFKNDQEVKEKTTVVTDASAYMLKVENKEFATKWELKLDPLKLSARLTVEPGAKWVRHLPDIEADQHIDIKIEENKVITNQLTYQDVMAKLDQLKVKHGFNQAAIMKAITTTEPGTFEIATGIKPKEGKNGWVEIKVTLETSQAPKKLEDGRVDYREIQSITTVERGAVIAIIHPPIPGQIGYTVTNEPLPAKQTVPIIVRAGKGIMLVDDKVVALESGRPHFEQRGQLFKVEIMPKLKHNGDVDLSSGNLRFTGDIDVLGEVKQNMIVEARGNINVYKTINQATITASGAIMTYGNVIGSKLSAGKHNMIVTELGKLLGEINQHVEKMIQLIKQLTSAAAFKSNDISSRGVQPLIRILLEKKFKPISPLVQQYVEMIGKAENYLDEDEWKETSLSLSTLFLSLSNEVISIDWLLLLSKKMQELHKRSTVMVEPDSFISLPHAFNSCLYSSGNVSIVGKGCINTKIHAGGSLHVSGVVRGEEVYGGLGVKINEVGSLRGKPTVICVPNNQTIEVNKAMEGTVIQIGSIKHILKETVYHVRARLDHNQCILFETYNGGKS